MRTHARTHTSKCCLFSFSTAGPNQGDFSLFRHDIAADGTDSRCAGGSKGSGGGRSAGPRAARAAASWGRQGRTGEAGTTTAPGEEAKKKTTTNKQTLQTALPTTGCSFEESLLTWISGSVCQTRSRNFNCFSLPRR